MSEIEELENESSPEPADPSLITDEEARGYLNLGAKDDPKPAVLGMMIGGLSRRIGQFTGRTYINSDADDKASARTFILDPADRSLAIDDCRDITKVLASATPREDDTWEDVAGDLFVVEPLGGPVFDTLRFLSPSLLPATGVGWSALGLHASPASSPSVSPWPNQVRAELQTRVAIKVTAKWGYGPDNTTVPENVKLALAMWIQNITSRDLSHFTESAKVWVNIEMPPDVKDILGAEATASGTVAAI